MATCNKGVPEHQRDIQMLRVDGSSFLQNTGHPRSMAMSCMALWWCFTTLPPSLKAKSPEGPELVQEQRDQLPIRPAHHGREAAGFAHENQPLTAISNYARVSKRMMAKDEPDLELLVKPLKIDAQSTGQRDYPPHPPLYEKPATGKEELSVPSCWRTPGSLPRWTCATTKVA